MSHLRVRGGSIELAAAVSYAGAETRPDSQGAPPEPYSVPRSRHTRGPAMKSTVLIVDNDLDRGEALEDLLAPGYDCRRVRTLDQAFGAIGRTPWEVVLANYDLGPGQSGLELLQ